MGTRWTSSWFLGYHDVSVVNVIYCTMSCGEWYNTKIMTAGQKWKCTRHWTLWFWPRTCIRTCTHAHTHIRIHTLSLSNVFWIWMKCTPALEEELLVLLENLISIVIACSLICILPRVIFFLWIKERERERGRW